MHKSFRRLFLPVLIGLLLINSATYAQNDSLSQDSAYQFAAQESSTGIKPTRLIPVATGISGLYLGSMAYLQFVWYKDVPRVPFQFYHDLQGYNQIDKFGHAYGAYLESYLGYKALLWTGLPKKKALWIGGSMGFLMQLPIEIWDGMYEGWGFSWSDVAANTLGSALVIGQELAFNEQLITYKFSFSPSPYARQANGYLGTGFNQLFYDYNGHSYWLSFGLNRVLPNKHIPNWLCLSLGYSAGGMFGEFKNLPRYRGQSIPETERYRQFLLSFDIDFSKIPTRNPALKKLFNSLFLIKVPFPALEYNTKSQLVFHPFYY